MYWRIPAAFKNHKIEEGMANAGKEPKNLETNSFSRNWDQRQAKSQETSEPTLSPARNSWKRNNAKNWPVAAWWMSTRHRLHGARGIRRRRRFPGMARRDGCGWAGRRGTRRPDGCRSSRRVRPCPKLRAAYSCSSPRRPRPRAPAWWAFRLLGHDM